MSQYNLVALANARRNSDPILQEELEELLDEVDASLGPIPKGFPVGVFDLIALKRLARASEMASPHARDWLRRRSSSSLTTSGGSTSERVDAICPSLTNDGPRSSSTLRMRTPIEPVTRVSLEGSSGALRRRPRRVAISPNPCRTRTFEMSRTRPRSRAA